MRYKIIRLSEEAKKNLAHMAIDADMSQTELASEILKNCNYDPNENKITASCELSKH